MPLFSKSLLKKASRYFKEERNIKELLEKVNKDANTDLKWENIFTSLLLQIIELERNASHKAKKPSEPIISELREKVRGLLNVIKEAKRFNDEAIPPLEKLVTLCEVYEARHWLIFLRLRFQELRDLCRKSLEHRRSIEILLSRILGIISRLVEKLERLEKEKVDFGKIKKELEEEKEELKESVRGALRTNLLEMDVNAVIDAIETQSGQILDPKFRIYKRSSTQSIKRKYLRKRITRTLTICVMLLGMSTEAAVRSVTYLLTNPNYAPLRTQEYIDYCARTSNRLAPKRQYVEFKSEDGVTIKGEFMPNKETRKVIIVCHGMWQNRRFVVPYVEFLNKSYNVLSFDFRGCGESGGKNFTYGIKERLDLKGAIQFLKDEGFEDCAILGLSAGAYISMLVAQEEPFVKAMVQEGGFVNFEDVWNHHNNKSLWFVPGMVMGEIKRRTQNKLGVKLKDMPRLKRCNKPILIIHNPKDPLIPFEHAKRIHEMASAPKRIWRVSNKPTEHGAVIFLRYTEQYVQQVSRFFSRHYPPRTGK